jgi:prepilin-type N-terminal cleavage/methylation domain-containing protein
MRKNEKGFTLVELIVVIAIVAILAAVGIIGYTQFIQNARNTKAQSELDQLINVLYADSLVDGIKLSDLGVEIGENQEDKELVLAPQQGKVVFADGIGQDDFVKLMGVYNPEGLLEGKFTLSSGMLKYEVDRGNGSAVVVYGGAELTYPYTSSGEGEGGD